MKHRTRGARSRAGSGHSALLRRTLAALLGAAMIAGAANVAMAVVSRGEFPSAKQVKASMKGSGSWDRSLGDPNFKALGAQPEDCRSDLPFAKATEFRNGYFSGPVAGTKRHSGVAEITIYRFASAQDATSAMGGLPTFLSDCAKSVEWVCENCDGIETIYRTPVAARDVGEQSVSWNQRSVGMGVANGRVIAAREGSSIVVTEASHQTDPERTKTPPRPTWKQTESVAKKALAKARQ